MLRLSELRAERTRLDKEIDELEDRYDDITFAIAAMSAFGIDEYNGAIEQLNDMYDQKLAEIGLDW